ncbi:hypothetical protein BBP40_000172 [Aspergillus hancockii]|nr:hypothetical protein BBP40_000172 [Aspergillus hancockii]
MAVTQLACVPIHIGNFCPSSHRRVANAPLFSVRAVGTARGLIDRQVERLVDNFVQSLETGGPLELFKTFTAFTTDTSGLYAFDLDFRLMKTPQAAENWRKTMQSVAAATPMVKQFPCVTQTTKVLLAWLVEYCFPDMRALLKVHSDVREQVFKYLNAKSTPSDVHDPQKPSRERYPTIFQILDNSSLPPHEKSPDRLQQEDVALLLAGRKTVARILVHAIFHSLTNPEESNKRLTELQ